MAFQKVNYYYLKWGDIYCLDDDEQSHPYATVAVIINNDGTIHRGVAYCSMQDSFVKAIGRKKALARLMKTIELQADIKMDTYAQSRGYRVFKDNPCSFNDFSKDCLAFYADKPTELENRLYFSRRK